MAIHTIAIGQYPHHNNTNKDYWQLLYTTTHDTNDIPLPSAKEFSKGTFYLFIINFNYFINK